MTRTLIFGIIILISYTAIGKPKDHLLQCWNKQGKPLQDRYMNFAFQEKLSQLEHSFEPWQQTNYSGKGNIWINADNFFKQDTLMQGSRAYFSKTQLSKTELLYLDYGDKNLFAVTKGMFAEQIIKTVRYSPIGMIHYFVQNKVPYDKASDTEYARYIAIIHKTIVTLEIRKSDNLLVKIITISDDALLGDVTTTFSFGAYSTVENIAYPKSVSIEKYNGKVKDEVQISIPKLIQQAPELLTKPDGYELKEDTEAIPDIALEKFNDHIFFLALKHTDDRVLIVEFTDFVLVADAPVNSRNGELIIDEVKKIAHGKPIRYFTFGHFHPHYLGGIRPFIHIGSEIICSKSDEAYVQYLASAPHKMNPDNLQREFMPLKLKDVGDSLTISDDKLKMKIYFIGKKSEHTNDYLIYYFPTEKLLFEDDLIWIAKSGDIKKASGRQAGLYNAVKDLHLEIKTIVQSWPVKDYGVKTVIPFDDLEKSMMIR